MALSKLISYEFDPFELTGREDLNLTKSQKNEILNELKDLVLEEVLSTVHDGVSPVSGRGKFKQLSKKYADITGKDRSPVTLELNGDLLDSVDVIKSGSKLVIGVSKSEEDKADGHNNFSGDSKLPTRRFIPFEDDDETFKKQIIEKMRETIDLMTEDL